VKPDAGASAERSGDSVMAGFPPPPERRVSLENWDQPPFNRWTFQRVRQVIPTREVSRGTEPACLLEGEPRDLDHVSFETVQGRTATLAQLLEETFTDGFLVLHRGKVVTERYFNGMQPATLHLSQSVAKTVVGTVAGILIHRGTLDPDAPLTRYVPELERCGYGDARLRHLLDMASGVRFTEDYGHPDSDMTKLDVASGWRPNTSGEAPDSIYDLALTLPKECEHGTRFQYRSIETDVISWCMERATGLHLTELVGRELWAKLGAEWDACFTVDRAGTALSDGGFNATLRDYARFGQTILQDGRFNGGQIVPAEWVAACRSGDNALFGEPHRSHFPNGAYRNKWWIKDVSARVTMALGVFGQMIYVDPDAALVAVKLSTWPGYLNPEFNLDTIRAVEAVAAALNAGSG
jgi:CubicO group peptidase (beta-lactamase class C family)